MLSNNAVHTNLAEMGDRAKAKWAEKCGFAVPSLGGGGYHLTRCAWAEAYLRTMWYPDASSRLSTIDMSPKVRGCCALFGEVSWSLSNTMLPRPRTISAPSGIV